MVKFFIHHNLEGDIIYLSQFYQTNMQTRKMEALMEILTAHLKSDIEREGQVAMADTMRFSTYSIESQEYSMSSLKSSASSKSSMASLYTSNCFSKISLHPVVINIAENSSGRPLFIINIFD